MLKTIGLIGLGEMGGGLARAWTASGRTVLAVTEGRSAETRARAEEAGVTAAPDLAAIAAAADLVVSVLPPSAAEAAGAEMAALAQGGAEFLFLEANAISPGLTRRIAAGFAGAGAEVIDGGVIGMPPAGGARPRLFLSGPAAERLAPLDGAGVDLRFLGDEIGAASGFKMTYAAITKGTNALLANALLAAEAQGFLGAYLAEVRSSQGALAAQAERAIPALPADAGRWVREMEEIAASFRALNLAGGFHDGAAEIMALLDASPFGGETRRTRDRSRDMEATVKAIAAARGRAD